MRAVDLIRKKRDGRELDTAEIEALISGYCRGEIPDYQMAAWAMAVCFQGMSARETADLTMAMARSGDLADLSSIRGKKVDKHSTGGVGDSVTLVAVPLAAAAGVPVAKMSGRGLGHTGGTIDKLEAIPGFVVELSGEQFVDQVNRIGAAVISQTGNITPADKKLYSLRDVTATVDSIPLIASSVMSKKIASGADALVLDVKTGDGAFMKTLEQSLELARAMVAIGEQVGRETIALVTGMDQPLGRAVGNALEVKEAIAVLQGRGSRRLTELSLAVAAYMMLAGGKADSFSDALRTVRELLDSGAALNKLKEMAAAQKGDVRAIDDPDLLPTAKRIVPVTAAGDGYVGAVAAEAIGAAAMRLGAGRATKDAVIDLSVGIVLHKEIGDFVRAGEPLAELHCGDGDVEAIAGQVREAFRLVDRQPEPPPLIYAVVTKHGVAEPPSL